MGRPAIVAAFAVGPGKEPPQSLDGSAPIVLSVKFIDREVLSDLAAQLRLDHLRIVGDEPAAASKYSYALPDPSGRVIARFAWTPKKPGAEIVDSVVPFIAVALAGFALLAAFVLGYMRRTAAAIAIGESRLRHLAMHDPLCGLPNRIYFGERLEAVIEEIHGGAPAAVFYIDLNHFNEVNDTLGHPAGDELIRNVMLRLSRALRDSDLVARLGGDEFAVISSIGLDQAKTLEIAQRIISALCAPYAINKQSIVIGASIGIAIIDANCASRLQTARPSPADPAAQAPPRMAWRRFCDMAVLPKFASGKESRWQRLQKLHW
jgi:diguanylate cyclase (GGDEF)-like protein